MERENLRTNSVKSETLPIQVYSNNYHYIDGKQILG